MFYIVFEIRLRITLYQHHDSIQSHSLYKPIFYIYINASHHLSCQQVSWKFFSPLNGTSHSSPFITRTLLEKQAGLAIGVTAPSKLKVKMSDSTAPTNISNDAQMMRVLTNIHKQYRDLELWRTDLARWRREETIEKLLHPHKYPVNAYNDAIEAEYKFLEEERERLSAQTEQVKAAERERIGVEESTRDYHRYDPPPLYTSLPPDGSAPERVTPHERRVPPTVRASRPQDHVSTSERTRHLTAITTRSSETISDGIRSIAHPPEGPRDLVARTANAPVSHRDLVSSSRRQQLRDIGATLNRLEDRFNGLDAAADRLADLVNNTMGRNTGEFAAGSNVNSERPYAPQMLSGSSLARRNTIRESEVSEPSNEHPGLAVRESFDETISRGPRIAPRTPRRGSDESDEAYEVRLTQNDHVIGAWVARLRREFGYRVRIGIFSVNGRRHFRLENELS